MSQEPDYLVKIHAAALEGAVVLLSDGQWHAADDEEGSQSLHQGVTFAFKMYMMGDYSPSHGYPGYAFAQDYAKKRGYAVETHPPPPLPEGAVS